MKPWPAPGTLIVFDEYDTLPPAPTNPIILTVYEYAPGGRFVRARARQRDGWRTFVESLAP